MAVIYHPGDKVRMSLAVTDSTGAAVDPTGVALKHAVGTQAAVLEGYNPGNIVRDGVGLYHFDYDTSAVVVTQRSLLTEQWIDTGTGQSIGLNQSSFIDPLPL